jgi:general secretion pathway protein B
MDNLIDIDALKPGMVIVKITEQNGPIKIRKSGLVTSMEMVTGLGEMGVQQVEIDPAQTVEIDKPKIKKSQTQKLLESERVGAHGADTAVSDQFNRSLFLPSVQALPSRWQFYAKPIAQGVLVVLFGFVLGWGTTLAPALMAKFNTPAPQTSAAVALPEVAKTANGNNNTEGAVASDKERVNGSDSVNSTIAQAVPNSQPENQGEQGNGAPSSPVIDSANADTDSQTRPASEPYVEPEPSISPDLLKRFEKAITELDSEPSESFETVQPTNDDVTRIDQLPAWVLTQLPAMAFTSHIYRSSPEDRWVKVNDRTLHEGDMIDDKVRIEHIEPQSVILTYLGHTFSMSALSEW